MDQKAKDFIFSFVLIIFGIFTTIGGVQIYHKAAERPYNITEFSISPGFLPVILGVALILCSMILLVQSLSGKESYKVALKDNLEQFKAWFKPAVTSKDTISMVVGTLIMFVYCFFLIDICHYMIASFVFLVGIMLFLKASKWWKIVLISAGAMGLIYLLFKVAFRAALP